MEIIVLQRKNGFPDQLKQPGAVLRSRGTRAKPRGKQVAVESVLPAVARWVNGCHGPIEIGDREGFGFIARALDYGGPVFEQDKSGILAEAMTAPEKGLAEWFEEQRIDDE